MFRTTRIALMLALAAAASAPAHAAEFTLMIHEPAADIALRSDAGARGQAYWQAYATCSEFLKSSGTLRGGAALHGDAEAVVLGPDGERARQTGGKPAGLQQLGGYFIVDAADLDAALALARKAPAIARGGSVEVRPAYPAPPMR